MSTVIVTKDPSPLSVRDVYTRTSSLVSSATSSLARTNSDADSLTLVDLETRSSGNVSRSPFSNASFVMINWEIYTETISRRLFKLVDLCLLSNTCSISQFLWYSWRVMRGPSSCKQIRKTQELNLNIICFFKGRPCSPKCFKSFNFQKSQKINVS